MKRWNTKYLYKKKCIEENEFPQFVSTARKSNKNIVFSNGCFDVIHKGHIYLLRQSRQLGDVLIVGINSDGSIKKLKGESRPINCLEDRMYVLEAFEFVDFIIPFEEDTPYSIIQNLRPQIYTKGNDYAFEDIIGPGLGGDIIEAYGGRVVQIPIITEISSTRLILEAQYLSNS